MGSRHTHVPVASLLGQLVDSVRLYERAHPKATQAQAECSVSQRMGVGEGARS